MSLKRLWDITNKKMVFVKGPTGHDCQLWVDEATEKMYYYDMAQWIEYTQSALNDGRTYGPTWEVVDSDDEMGVYDTNEPTDLFVWESGDKVSYVFKDWNGTVLKEGKVAEGTKPTAPADPTREATAQYTYTFSGWKPAVGPIYKKTDFEAQFDSTVNEYDVTIESNDTDYGTVDVALVEGQPYGTAISVEDNVLTIGEAEVTATAEEGCVFSSWGELPATVTGDLTITATFIDPEEIIYNDLDSLDADALLAKITEEKASDGEWTQTINGREYSFEVVTDGDFDNEANAILNDFYGYNWTAQVHVEVDQELQENTLVIGDITKEAVTPAEE